MVKTVSIISGAGIHLRRNINALRGTNCPRVRKLQQCAVLSYQFLLFQLQLHLGRKLGFTRKRPTAKHQMELGNPVEEEEEGL